MERPLKRPTTYEEIQPLIEMCRAGKLFAVQSWIKEGRPVNLPPCENKGRRKWSPLEYAIHLGFHSMVEVLLEAGAEIECGRRYNALRHAVEQGRPDIVELLLQHGASIHSVDMREVFSTYKPELMEFFIERGADVETDNPLAAAFCDRIRPALRILKQYKDRFPSFQEQVNIALRYHCKEGNHRWIALMLWAGADPYAKGPVGPDDLPDPEIDHSALELAAVYDHFEIFKMRQIRLDPKHPNAFGLVRQACYAKTADLLIELLHLGFPVSDQNDGGSSLIFQLINCMSWSWEWTPSLQSSRRNLDTEAAREKMKMLHMIVKHGARWVPEKPEEIGYVRRELLRMSADYTAELVWIMATYCGCSRTVIGDLLRTSSIRRHAEAHLSRIEELMTRLPTGLSAGSTPCSSTELQPGDGNRIASGSGNS